MLVSHARTRWGGIADGAFTASGYFRVDRVDGVWWLVDPDGGRFLSKGVNTVRFDQDSIQATARLPYAEACGQKYGSIDAWRRAAAQRLAGWGFNTLGSWSDSAVAGTGVPLAVAPNLDLGMSFAWQNNIHHPTKPRQDFPDVFDPEFPVHVDRRAREYCTPRASEASLLGWFTDNELRWGPDWRGPEHLLPLFLKLAPETPGRIVAADWLRRRGGNETALSPADCVDFAGLVADRYFALTLAAIGAVDSNHLVLGCRFALPPPKSVIEAASRHLALISFNCYDPEPSAALKAYAITGKPCLIGEFSFRAADSGLPNTNGAGPKVATQAERAACFRRYVTRALQSPALVGYHWFEHADQPAEGRFDGENSNFGTVTIEDCVYEELTQAMTALNAEAETLHASAGVVV